MLRNWRIRLIILLTLALLLPLIFTVNGQVRFEHTLNSLLISFNDFGPEYKAALVAANARWETLYYNFTSNTSVPSSDISDVAAPASSSTPTAPIPRHIHFIYIPNLYAVRPNGSTLASERSNTPELCRRYNPTYEITIWNATTGRSLLEEHYAYFLPTYDSYPFPIQRIDALKYFILLHHGGVYLDMDVSCRRQLEPLLKFDAWFPKAKPLGVNNDVFAAKAGHPLMEEMVRRLEGRSRSRWWEAGSTWLTVFWSTGPRFASDVLNDWARRERTVRGNQSGQGQSEAEVGDGFRVLPEMFYSEEFTFFGHRKGGSWYGTDVAIVLWVLARPWVIVLPVFVGLLLMLTPIRRRLRRRRKEGLVDNWRCTFYIPRSWRK